MYKEKPAGRRSGIKDNPGSFFEGYPLLFLKFPDRFFHPLTYPSIEPGNDNPVHAPLAIEQVGE